MRRGSIIARKARNIRLPEYNHVIFLACLCNSFFSSFESLNASLFSKYSRFFLSVYLEKNTPIIIPKIIDQTIIGVIEKVISSNRIFLPIT